MSTATAAAMDDATMAQYADVRGLPPRSLIFFSITALHCSSQQRSHDSQWLDNLERTDPDGYQRLLHAMKAQVDGVEAPIDSDAALFEALGSVKTADAPPAAFTPQFPGNRVMEPHGLTAKQEGVRNDRHSWVRNNELCRRLTGCIGFFWLADVH